MVSEQGPLNMKQVCKCSKPVLYGFGEMSSVVFSPYKSVLHRPYFDIKYYFWQIQIQACVNFNRKTSLSLQSTPKFMLLECHFALNLLVLYDLASQPFIYIPHSLVIGSLVIWIFVDDKCINHAGPHLDFQQSYLMPRAIKLQVSNIFGSQKNAYVSMSLFRFLIS